VQFAVNEECVALGECARYAAFVGAGKPVFHIEYPDKAGGTDAAAAAKLCATDGAGEGAAGFSTVVKKVDLDGWVQYCDGKTYTTPTTNG
jgi:hypothetical protein